MCMYMHVIAFICMPVYMHVCVCMCMYSSDSMLLQVYKDPMPSYDHGVALIYLIQSRHHGYLYVSA